MKRNTRSAPNSPTETKKTRTNTEKLTSESDSGGEDMSPLPPTTAQSGANQPDDDSIMYTCETRNRFAMLPIQQVSSPVLRPLRSLSK